MSREVCDRCGKVTRPDDVHTCVPKALQLVATAHLGYRAGWQREAAAELRRLHEAHDWQYKMAGDRLRRIEKLEAVNQELLEALKLAQSIIGHPDDAHSRHIAAAIAKAEAA
jgi:hypothetical protein